MMYSVKGVKDGGRSEGKGGGDIATSFSLGHVSDWFSLLVEGKEYGKAGGSLQLYTALDKCV